VSTIQKVAVAVGIVIAATFALSACSSTDAAPRLPHVSYTSGQLSGEDPNFGKNMQACMKDAGFDVTIESDGSIQTMHVPDAQIDKYDAASHACSAKFGYDKPIVQSAAQKKALYAGLLSLTQCLKDHGYVYDSVPSEQAFQDGAIFDPYSAVAGPSAKNPASYDKYQQLLKVCPYP
jgi:hypothetical protein